MRVHKRDSTILYLTRSVLGFSIVDLNLFLLLHSMTDMTAGTSCTCLHSHYTCNIINTTFRTSQYQQYQSINCTSPSTVPVHQLYQSINCTSPSTVPVHQYQSSNCTSPSTVPVHQLYQSINTSPATAPVHQLYQSINCT